MAEYISNYDRPGTAKRRPGRYWPAVGFMLSAESMRPDGVAFPAGVDERENQLWRLTIGKDELPGRFLMTDGKFVPFTPPASLGPA